MSLLDNSLASKLQLQVWEELKDRRKLEVCLKHGVIEYCFIDKIFDRDGTTIKKYVIKSEYQMVPNTLDGEIFYDYCKSCGDKLLGGDPLPKVTNRLEVEKLFNDLKKTLIRELFLITSRTIDSDGAIPEYKMRRNKVLQQRKHLDERKNRGLGLDREQKEFLASYDEALFNIDKSLEILEYGEESLMLMIDDEIKKIK